MSTLSVRHGWTLRRDDAVSCTCEPANRRHVYGYQCIPREEALRWARAHGCNPAVAREMLWLERTFGRQEESLCGGSCS